MSFLDSVVDLSDTIFTEGHLIWARQYLESGIRQSYPQWLDNPEGYLGKLWLSDSQSSACFFIEFAGTINDIWQKVFPGHIPRLNAKIMDLLRIQSEAQFMPLLTELLAGAYLAKEVDTILIEPLVKDEELFSGARSKSPDYAFKIPEGLIYSDVTVFSSSDLDNWQKAADLVAMTLQGRLLKQGRAIRLHIQLPLQKFDSQEVVRQAWRKMRDPLLSMGEVIVLDKGIIRWSSLSIAQVPNDTLPTSFPDILKNLESVILPSTSDFEIIAHLRMLGDDPSGFIDLTPFGIVHTSNFSVDRATLVQGADIVVTTREDVHNINGRILKAMKNKLQDKREQFSLRHQKPYLLIVRPGHYRLHTEGLVDMINQDIWRKKDYGWVSGILLLSPRQGCRPTNKGYELLLCLNPAPECPLTGTLKSFFERNNAQPEAADAGLDGTT